jgi:Cu/Ag efflux protein CusF
VLAGAGAVSGRVQAASIPEAPSTTTNTMQPPIVFRVQDPGMLKSVNVGDKVKFEPDRINGQFTVTKIQKAK